MPEFALIDRIRRRAAGRGDVVLGIGDDAALLAPPAGMQLVAAQDTLNLGVHFPAGTAAADIGWKALAVNLSDLAAMGAMPAWCLLSLSLPDADAGFVDAFIDGFCTLADRHDVALVGGDTTRGPLSISVAAFGFVEPGRALRRAGARVGDQIWITGTPGDAAAALRLAEAAPPALRARLDRPTPRLQAGRALAGLAHACIDVSDGLLADLGHVLAAGGVGAVLHAPALPVSPALLAAIADPAERLPLQLAGGDDYELCFTAPPAAAAAITAALAACATPATVIGRVRAAAGLDVLDGDGRVLAVPRHGYQHFEGPP